MRHELSTCMDSKQLCLDRLVPRAFTFVPAHSRPKRSQETGRDFPSHLLLENACLLLPPIKSHKCFVLRRCVGHEKKQVKG